MTMQRDVAVADVALNLAAGRRPPELGFAGQVASLGDVRTRRGHVTALPKVLGVAAEMIRIVWQADRRTVLLTGVRLRCAARPRLIPALAVVAQ